VIKKNIFLIIIFHFLSTLFARGEKNYCSKEAKISFNGFLFVKNETEKEKLEWSDDAPGGRDPAKGSFSILSSIWQNANSK
jgi:hypothetical protein